MKRLLSVNGAVNYYLIVLVLLLAGSFAAVAFLGFSWSLWINQGVFLLLAAFAAWRSGESWRELFRFRWVSPGILALSFVLGIGLWWGGIAFNIWAMRLVDSLFGPMPDPGFSIRVFDQVLILIALVILAPLCEEILFRGYFLRAFERQTLKPWVWSGLFFGLMHVGNGISQVAGATVYGLVFGYIVWKSNSIWPGILAHMGVNFNAVLFGGILQYSLGQNHFPQWLFGASAIGLAIFGLCFLVLRWQLKPDPEPSLEPRPPLGKGQLFALVLSVLILLGLGGADIAGRLLAPPQWQESNFTAREFTGDMRFGTIEVTEVPITLQFLYSFSSKELDVVIAIRDPQGNLVWQEEYLARDITLERGEPVVVHIQQTGTWELTVIGHGKETSFEAKWKLVP